MNMRKVNIYRRCSRWRSLVSMQFLSDKFLFSTTSKILQVVTVISRPVYARKRQLYARVSSGCREDAAENQRRRSPRDRTRVIMHFTFYVNDTRARSTARREFHDERHRTTPSRGAARRPASDNLDLCFGSAVETRETYIRMYVAKYVYEVRDAQNLFDARIRRDNFGQKRDFVLFVLVSVR